MIFHVYGHDQCPFCVKAKNLLTSKGEEFSYYDVKQDQSAYNFIDSLFGEGERKTVPQIFVGEKGQLHRIGGYEQLVSYLRDAEYSDDIFA